MDWLRENWFSVIIFILFIAIHLFGHGSHGMGCGGHREEDKRRGHGEGSSENKEHKGGHGCF